MTDQSSVHAVLGSLHSPHGDTLARAMMAAGWQVTQTDDLSQLLTWCQEGRHQLAVVVIEHLTQLSPDAVRILHNLQATMSVVILVPDRSAAFEAAPLLAAMPAHVHSLREPADAMMECLRAEVRLAMLSGPHLTILCVDSDQAFLDDIKDFLPACLRGDFPGARMDFEFCTSHQEALDAIERLPDLTMLIADQGLPGMNGTELLARIKAVRPSAIRILLAGHAALACALTAFNDRILDKCLPKPVEDYDDFAGHLRQLLREHWLDSYRQLQLARLRAQLEFVLALGAAGSPEKAVSLTLGFIQEYIAPTGAAVLLLDGGRLVVRQGFNLPTGMASGSAVPTGRHVLGWVVRHGMGILANEASDLPADAAGESPLGTPCMAAPLVSNRQSLGVLVATGNASGRRFTREQWMLMSFLAEVAGAYIGSLQDRHGIENHYLCTMTAMMQSMEAKDPYTSGHTVRVTKLAMELGRTIGLSKGDLEDLRRAGILHDIGKIAIPDGLFGKSGRLSDDEYHLVQEHPRRADKILRHMRFLDAVRMMVRGHHERYDGKGYPDGLCGEEIPLGARILAIADSYDAMTSQRPYRKPIPPADALEELARNAGQQFDPRLVVAFLAMTKDNNNRQKADETADEQVEI